MAAPLDPFAALRWLNDVGADDAVLEAPVDRYQAQTAAPAREERPVPAREAAREPQRRAEPARPAYEQGTAREIEAGLRPVAGLDRSADLQSAKALAAATVAGGSRPTPTLVERTGTTSPQLADPVDQVLPH